MKRMCFGTLLNLIYQAKGSGVTYKSICASIFLAYGCVGMENRDKSLPSHLKTGHDNVPPDVIEAARNIMYEEAINQFQNNVVDLIAEDNQKQFIYAVKAVLKDDPVSADTIIGYVAGFEKDSIVNGTKFVMAPFLASLFKYAIVDVSNHDCADNLRNFDKNYLWSVDSNEQIFIDSLLDAEKEMAESTPLKRTLHDQTFNRTFRKITSVIVSGQTHPSTADIFCADVNNGKLRFSQIKNFLAENLGSYVFSRSKLKALEERPRSALGVKALQRFQKAYGENAESILGELMLYVFLEQELNAPKIMSKIEFSENGGMASKSDGIHLLATTEFGRPFNQLVFGASNIQGSLICAIDRAFERISNIDDNYDIEFRTVENTFQYFVFDNATNEYIRDIMIPRKHYTQKPDMAFGVFLGYTLVVNSLQKDSAMYRVAAESQLRQDIETAKDYIASKIRKVGMEGYSFYCYVLPFNDAPSEKTVLIKEMLEG